jgi:hypothetical protein
MIFFSEKEDLAANQMVIFVVDKMPLVFAAMTPVKQMV